ncbi:MAG: hypothetical protein IT268_09060 [Saprospiraceae bacterium]|nr:hypothetical protein [Saprospiraceae bacterium]
MKTSNNQTVGIGSSNCKEGGFVSAKITKNIFLVARFFLSALFLICIQTAVYSQNQLKINVQVQPPYSPFLNDYLGLKDKTVLTVTNTTSQTIQYYLKVSLTNNDNFSAKTKDDYKPATPMTIQGGQTVMIQASSSAGSSFSEENIEVDYGDYTLSDVLRDGVLPDGKYNLCVTAFDYTNDQQISSSATGCKLINISYLNAPRILACDNKSFTQTMPQNINLSWSPVTGNNQNKQILYDLYIAPITEAENPQDIIETGIATGSPNLIKVSGIVVNAYTYSVNKPALTIGKYAWAVKAAVADKSLPIENDGLSNVCTFDYKPMEMKFNNVQMNVGPECKCKSQLPNGLDPIQGSPAVGQIVNSGFLKVTLTAVSKSDNGYTGTGTVPLPILNNGIVKVNVSFTNIDIKKSGNEYYQTSGIIEAVMDEKASFLPKFNPIDPGSLNLDPQQMQSLSSFFENYSNQLISKIKNYPNTIAYNLPIGLDEKAMNIAITGLTLAPEQSYFDAVSVLDIIDGNTKVALIGQGICIDAGSFCGNATLSLMEDFNVPSIGISLKGNGKNDGTSISFDKDGFKNLHIAATYTFPDNSLVEVASQKPAAVTLTSDTDSGWSDWLAEVKFSEFYMAGFPDVTFGPDANGTKIMYDHSDKRNPADIPSPYTSEDNADAPINTNQPTWRGFYIPSVAIKLPPSLTNVNGNPLVVKAEKLIFDGGLSGNVSVNNIMSINDGSLDGWYYSIDQFQINFWKNTFKSSSLSGKIVLPISRKYDDTSNQLDYTCTLSKPANSSLNYNFVISPKDNIAFNVLWANCKFKPGTNIQITKTNDGKFVAMATLNGQMTITSKIDNLPDVNIADVKFENLRFQSQKPYFTPGQIDACLFSTASPQHSIAGFSINFDPTPGKGISLYSNANNGVQLGLKFNAQLKLVKDVDFVPKADVSFNIFGNLKMNGTRPEWDGVGANISKIKFEAGAKIGPLGIIGEIAYFNDNNGSYGFMGGLTMDAAGVVTIGAKAQFGYSANEGGFNYFFIDGMVDFKSNGIPMGPALAIYGFGGGAFYNMTIPQVNMNGANITGSPAYVFDPNDPQAGVSMSGIVYTPKKGLFSVKAAVLFGLTARNVLDADGSVTMNFNTNTGSVLSIDFQATGRFITKADDPIPIKNTECMGKLTIYMQLNFDEASILFHADIKAGVPTHTDINLFYIDAGIDFYAGRSGWFVHVGTPWKDGNLKGGTPITLTVFNKLKFLSYFECGTGSGKIFYKNTIVSGVNAVDPMPPIPNYIYDIIYNNNRSGENGNIDNSVNSFSFSKNDLKGGLAFGANFSTEINVNFLLFYLEAKFMVGFDLAFYELQKGAMCVNEKNEKMFKGVNGFYAMGQAYFGASIDVGIDIDLFFFSGKISIISAGVAAYVQFGAPSPSFATGAIGGRYSLLGGLIEGHFGVKFFWGEKCYEIEDESIDLIAEVNPTADFDKEHYQTPVKASQLQPVNLDPYVVFNFEIDRTFLIIANVDEKDPDNPGATYRQYRYYHILPEDISINVSGGLIEQNGVPLPKPLSINDFKVSNDHFVLKLKEPVMFRKETDFVFDIKLPVRIFNLRERSKQQAATSQGYKTDAELAGVNNFVRNQWDLATDANLQKYYDQRHVQFTTDCGIKYLEQSWITDIDPLHRSQNNPAGYSAAFNEKNLRKGTYFTPTYTYSINKPYAQQLISNTSKNNVKLSLEHPEINLSLDNGYLSNDFLCIPPDFVNNSDITLKISTFEKRNSGNTFKSYLVDAVVSADKRSITANLDKDFPKNSFVIVQMVLKKRTNPNSNNRPESSLVTKKLITNNEANVCTTIMTRTANLDAKLKSASELELFKWYFTTGSYTSYPDKMADMDIKVDTVTTRYNLIGGNKGMVASASFEAVVSTYQFKGNEKFDFHDVYDYNLNQVLTDGISKPFPKKLADGYLGFAFDNASQTLVDDFLRTYFDNEMVMKQFLKLYPDDYLHDTPTGQGGHVKLMNLFITQRMKDLTRWENVTKVGAVLPPLDYLPSELLYKGADFTGMDMGQLNIKKQILFSVSKNSRIKSYLGGHTKIIPAHIIGLNDIPNFKPGNGPVIFQAFMADMMQDFNNNILSKVAGAFNPMILNNKQSR